MYSVLMYLLSNVDNRYTLCRRKPVSVIDACRSWEHPYYCWEDCIAGKSCRLSTRAIYRCAPFMGVLFYRRLTVYCEALEAAAVPGQGRPLDAASIRNA
jgi:hypothetical protein